MSHLTVQEVADLLKISVWTVRRWVKIGQLKAIKVQNTLRIPESAIEELKKAS